MLKWRIGEILAHLIGNWYLLQAKGIELRFIQFRRIRGKRNLQKLVVREIDRQQPIFQHEIAAFLPTVRFLGEGGSDLNARFGDDGPIGCAVEFPGKNGDGQDDQSGQPGQLQAPKQNQDERMERDNQTGFPVGRKEKKQQKQQHKKRYRYGRKVF